MCRHVYNYCGILEPNIDMNLVLLDEATPGSYFEYSVCSSVHTAECSSGKLVVTSTTIGGDITDSAPIHVNCEAYSEYTLSITSYDKSGNEVSYYSGDLLCSYVRREINSLSSDDVKATMDAMYTLWSTGEEEGQSLYGENFHNSTFFVEAHHFNAAWYVINQLYY